MAVVASLPVLLATLLVVPDPAPQKSARDWTAEVRRVQARLPGPGFTVVAQPPFVIAGDGTPDSVAAFASGTVRWAAERLHADFFSRVPEDPVTVWLFKDAKSYRRNALALFGEAPSSPYGYFLSGESALVMNIATGGGTLVHEMVHAFMRADFPDCPAWINEGLASLFEQCSDCSGHICGLPNWRLPGLVEAVRAGSLPSFRALASTTSAEFYGQDKGTNYAQARYLFLYLQERGLLRDFFRRVRDDHAADPTGYASLVKVLDTVDMVGFQELWELWILTLRFR
jgi:hypothetical protein